MDRRPRTRVERTARAATSWRPRRRRAPGPWRRPRPQPAAPWPRARRRPPPGTTRRHRQRDVGVLADVVDDRRLQPAEAEVEAVVEHRPGEGDRRRVAADGLAIDRRPARVAEPQEPGHLVERLAGGIVDGLAEQAVAGRGRASRSASCGHPRRAAPPAVARASGPRGTPRRGAPRGGSRRRTARPRPAPSALAADTPTSRAPIRPGPTVQATASMPLRLDAGLDDRPGDRPG